MDWQAFIRAGSVTPSIEQNARQISFSVFSDEQCAEILSDLRGRMGGSNALAHQRDRFRDIDPPLTALLDALHYRESQFHGASHSYYLERKANFALKEGWKILDTRLQSHDPDRSALAYALRDAVVTSVPHLIEGLPPFSSPPAGGGR
jgi:hypothetical protein